MRPSQSLPRLLSMIASAALIVGISSAQPPPPAETCNGTENLGSADMLPQTLSALASQADFVVTGAGCSGTAELDHVTCFVPTTACSVEFTCDADVGAQLEGVLNVFEGDCVTTPSACLGSDAGFPASVTLALNAGTKYCAVCASGLGSVQAPILTLSETTGSCGALPVTLQSFSIGGGLD